MLKANPSAFGPKAAIRGAMSWHAPSGGSRFPITSTKRRIPCGKIDTIVILGIQNAPQNKRRVKAKDRYE
jgi:hypothetical protein